MKKTLIVSLFVVMLLGNTACNNSPCPENETSDETINHEQLSQEVHKLFEDTKTMMAEKNTEGLVNRFTENGKLKLPAAPFIQGHDALRENYTANTQLEDFKLDIKTLEIEISKMGDMAYVVGEFHVSFNTPQGLVKDNGITLLSLVREDNRWKIAAEVLSSMPQEM